MGTAFSSETGTAEVEGRGDAVAVAVDSVGAPDVARNCAVCGNAAEDAVVAECMHFFCRTCAQRAMRKKGRSCPRCKGLLKESRMVLVRNSEPLRDVEMMRRTPFETVFVLHGREGLFSLHFEQDECFLKVDADDVIPRSLRTFDDGTPLSKSLHFENWNFDEQTRIFKGEILFEKPVHGGVRTEYEIVFDEGFDMFESGSKKTIAASEAVLVEENFGENARTPILYRRVKENLYEAPDTVFVPELPLPWIVDRFVEWFRWIFVHLLGIPMLPLREAIREDVPYVETIGLGSFHFSRFGSYVDFSKSEIIRRQGLPSIIPFLRESFEPISRIFEGVAEFRMSTGTTFLAHYHFKFNRELGKIVEGEQKFYQVLRPRIPGDVLSQKYSNVAQDQLYLIDEQKYGFEGNKLRFRLLNPWQVSLH